MTDSLKLKQGDQAEQQALMPATFLAEIEANSFPDAVCLLDGRAGAEVTYGQLAHDVKVAAKVFEADKRRLAFLYATSSVDTVIAYLALIHAGHAVYLVGDGTDETALTQAVDLYAPDIVVGAKYSLPKDYVGTSEQRIPHVAFRRTENNRALHPHLTLLLGTSGSTGSCKLVRLSYRNVISNAHAIKQYLGISSSDRAITMLPLSYSYGLSVLHSHLVAGASIVLNQDPVVTREFWQAFNQRSCTSLAGVPYTHQTLLKLGIYRRAQQSLRYVTQAGGRMDVDTTREIHTLLSQRSIPLIVMYGQTEATARISYLPPEQLPVRVGSIGRAIPGGELTIVDESGTSRGVREIGEVLYRGPNVMMGYAESPTDLSRGDELSGVLRTGDLGDCDEEGFLFLTGRMKRIAKVLGLRISLDEVEAFLAATCLTAVVESHDKIRCFCEINADLNTDIDLAQLQKTVSEKLGLATDYVDLQAIATIPRTANGKFDYPKLEAL